MKIKQLQVTNFRQFVGTQTLEFASGDQSNVTIILGQNGAGKTGIFRAVLFALFGDIHLSQDAPDAEIHLINEGAMRASSAPVSATVSLSFDHDGHDYVIKREVRGRFDGTSYYQEPANNQRCTLTIDREGEEPQLIDKTPVVNDKIEAIIRSDIREFFFFDAESLQILSDLGKPEVRRSIQDGIYQLLQVQDLKKGRDLLDSMKRGMQRKINEVAKDNQVATSQKDLDQVESEMAENVERLDALKSEIKQAESERDIKKQKLEASSATRKLVEDIRRLQGSVDQQQQIVQQDRDMLASQIKTGAAQLFESITPAIKQNVAALRESGNDSIPKYILEQSVSDKLCALCGNDLAKDNDAFDHVQELLRLFKYSQTTSFLSSIDQGVDDVDNGQSGYYEKQKSALDAYANDSQVARRTQGDLDNMKNRLQATDNDVKEIQGLATAVDQIEEDLREYKHSQSELETQQGKLAQTRQTLNQEITKRLAVDTALKQQNNSVKLVGEMEASLETILKEYSDSSRQELQTQTLVLFKKMIAKKDQNLIDKVLITPKYQIKVFNANRRDLSNDLSQGEKQILSLSFIMALAQIAASGRTEMAFPLFMDTPFARIDGDNRDRLIEAIPTLTEQWVLLLTDTEFTSAERDRFLENHSVGAAYQLDNVDGNTRISAVPDLSLLELRGEIHG